jgi:transmembrane sensor
MISSLIQKLLLRTGEDHTRTDPGAGAIDRVIRNEQEELRAMDPDTRRRWLMLRNTITVQPVGQRTPERRFPARLVRPVLISGILASTASVVFILWTSAPVLDQTFSTGKGQMSTITLADSSDVILNHTSEVLVAAMAPGKERTIRLRGEAFFKVRRNGSPFRVETAAGTVEVLGTEFNVRERKGALEVAVLSGTVRVSVPPGGNDRTVLLTRGTILTLVHGDSSLAVQELRYATYPGWLHNRLIFQDRPLAAVCEELEDRFDVPVRVEGQGAGNQRISGTLESRTAESALGSLVALTSMHLRREANAYILY